MNKKVRMCFPQSPAKVSIGEQHCRGVQLKIVASLGSILSSLVQCSPPKTLITMIKVKIKRFDINIIVLFL